MQNCRFVARRILKERRRLIKNSVIFLKEVACQRKLEMIFEKLARTLFGCPEASTVSGYARTSLQNFSASHPRFHGCANIVNEDI